MSFAVQVCMGVFLGVAMVGVVLLVGFILLKLTGMKMFRDPDPYASRGVEFGRQDQEWEDYEQRQKEKEQFKD